MVEKKLQLDPGKYWRLSKPKPILMAIFLVMSTLFLCSILVSDQYTQMNGIWDGSTLMLINCRKESCRCSRGSEPLPRGIVVETSDLELKSIWRSSKNKEPKNLLAMAVGIEQKAGVDSIIQKFPSDSFTIMLFHYDGVVDLWMDLPWAASALHVVAINQTKWWFAKRFLHPDVVEGYHYIFLWDEDLGVDHFQADRFLEIVKEEGLEISQPALDPHSLEIHHRLTIRIKKRKMHRRYYKGRGNDWCNSTKPPCTGWVEMMAPVFSRASWRCAWHLIQNDLIHGWGIDMKLGYCAQGDPTVKVGVVDAEYIVHLGIPSLGGGGNGSAVTNRNSSVTGSNHTHDARMEVRRRSYVEMEVFKSRWEKAVKEDKCWRES